MADSFKKALPQADPLWVEHGYGTRFQGFQNLMRLRIRDILLVSSLYDLYVFEEDGRLYELIRSKYQGLNLSHAPELARVANGIEAIELIREERRFDLILTTLHIEDMRPADFARKVKEAGVDIPVVLLAFDNRELMNMLLHKEADIFDQVFIWQGDFRLLIAIIKHLEDRMNVEYDTALVGVQSIIVIENDVRYYSHFLPLIYLEIMRQSRRLISEGINLSHKQLRQRARPKILLCKTYEEAMDIFNKYKDTLLGIISDVDFPRNGQPDPDAGFRLARTLRQEYDDIPILLHSSNPAYREKAAQLGASFLLKNSPNLLEELREFMINHFHFGDFIFRDPQGREIARAQDLISLEKTLKKIPIESVLYHASRNDFSNWLKARTEFWLAHQLRPRQISDFESGEALHADLIGSLREYRNLRQRGIITEFEKESFDPYSSISRIGGGSLGGKARGLSFVNILINNYDVQDRFEGIRLFIPPAVVIGTDVFDDFMEKNGLKELAYTSTDNREILERFSSAPYFPESIIQGLNNFLDIIDSPLAVRSSSLLEDSHNHPFAGVYKTYMLPNSSQDRKTRLEKLLLTIKRIYASTYLRSAKEYIRATTYSLEEEKMAVIVQKMIGSKHGCRFYPAFSGVAKSYNFYPITPLKYSDGIVNVALGLGKMVVEGGSCVRFSPKYPNHIDQFSSIKKMLRDTQHTFFALDLECDEDQPARAEDIHVKSYPIRTAEEDGTIHALASTYSPENDRIYDGTSRKGYRVITFSPILKNKIFPLNDILDLLLDMGKWGMGTPVEIEFAVELNPSGSKIKEFALLQMRPMVLNWELEVLNLANYDRETLICESTQVLGNGEISDIYDIVMVDRDRFDRGRSQDVAMEISNLNARLIQEKRKYLLIGVGRWGSLDPWLGIPVTWDQISGAHTIIETGFKDFTVTPSQGSHFFQNLNSFKIGYFTVQSSDKTSWLDWEWLYSRPAVQSFQYTRLLRFQSPVVIKMSGHQNKGIILKPECSRGKKRTRA